MTLTECATTSCISRAIRLRSSTTARSASRGAALVGPRGRLVQLAGQARRGCGPCGPRGRTPPTSTAGKTTSPSVSGPPIAVVATIPAIEHRDAGGRAAAVLVGAEAEGQRQQREPDRRQVAGRRQPLGGQRHDASRQTVARSGHVRHHASGSHDARDGDDVERDRAAQVAERRRARRAPDDERDRRAAAQSSALRAPHAALPSGRRARRAWPPSRGSRCAARRRRAPRARRCPSAPGRAAPSSMTSSSTGVGRVADGHRARPRRRPRAWRRPSASCTTR